MRREIRFREVCASKFHKIEITRHFRREFRKSLSVTAASSKILLPAQKSSRWCRIRLTCRSGGCIYPACHRPPRGTSVCPRRAPSPSHPVCIYILRAHSPALTPPAPLRSVARVCSARPAVAWPLTKPTSGSIVITFRRLLVFCKKCNVFYTISWIMEILVLQYEWLEKDTCRWLLKNVRDEKRSYILLLQA